MYISCKELFQQIYENYSLDLLAGQKGLSSLVTGCYTIEEPEDMTCIKIGSLVFASGLASHRTPNWLYRFLVSAKENHACAVVFEIGEHLKNTDFNQRALTYCEEHNLPLVVMKSREKKLRLSALYAKCEEYLHASEKIRLRLETALQAIHHTTPADAEHISILEKAGFPLQDNYYVSAISLSNKTSHSTHSTMDTLCFPDISQDFSLYIVLSALKSIPLPTILYKHAGTTYVLYKCANTTFVKKFSQFITIKYRNCFGDVPLHFGVSDSFSSLTDLAAAKKQAKTAMQLAISKETPLLTYQDLGIFRIMLTVSDLSPLKAYVNEQLGAVKAYDAKHSSDFSNTLYLYLLYTGSIQAVAKASNCHRNTINHRIRMMKERMGYNLDDPQSRYELLFAFLADEYCKMNDQ